MEGWEVRKWAGIGIGNWAAQGGGKHPSALGGNEEFKRTRTC